MTDPAARVAHDLAEDGRCLGQIVDLISSRCPWQDWPEQSRADVLSACDARGLNPAERVKADALRWHLFRRHDVSQPGQEVPAAHRVVERVRSDLIGLVRLGSGRYLLGDIPGCGPDLEEVVPPTRPRSPDTPNCMPTRV
jgi:hypothetical protein